MQIIRQHPEAEHFILPELADMGAFCLVWNCHGLSRLGADTEVRSQPLRRFVITEIKQPCHEVDHISLCSAAEAVEILLV